MLRKDRTRLDPTERELFFLIKIYNFEIQAFSFDTHVKEVVQKYEGRPF